MKKSFLFLLLPLLFLGGLRAQKNTRTWSSGKLTWNDFQGEYSKGEISKLQYFFGYNSGKQKVHDTTLVRLSTFCTIDQHLSWINPSYKTDQYLRYNQVIFDIAEHYRRDLQYQLDRMNSVFDPEGIFHVLFTQCTDEVNKFQKLSDNGTDLQVIETWEKTVAGQLKQIGDQKLPSFTKRNFGYAMHADFGSGFFTGSLGEHFNPTFNFAYGFDFSYKEYILFINATMAGDKVKKDYFANQNWYKGQGAHVAIIDLSCGYALLDRSKIKLTPFAGLGITELSGKNRDDADNDLRLTDYNFIFGLNTDYKIRKKINLIPDDFFGVKEYVETTVRARLYITRANYFDDLRGYSINLTIGMCGIGHFLRLLK